MSIAAEDKAPDFKLQDQNGKTVSLADFRGKKAVVLYFYPRDETPGCTKEACSFRDSYEDFVKAGAKAFKQMASDIHSFYACHLNRIRPRASRRDIGI